MRRRAKICCRFLTFLLGLSIVAGSQVRADWKEKGAHVSREAFYAEEGESEISAEAVCEDGVLHLTVDATGKEDEYDTISFFKELDDDKDEYAGILLEVKNNSRMPVDMNIVCINQEYDSLMVRDDIYVVLKEDGKYRSQMVSNQVMTVPEQYEGEIYVPLCVFSLNGSSEEAKIDDIRGIGFTLVASQTDTVDIEISDIFLTEQSKKTQNTLAYVVLEGDETLLKPTQEESVSQYRAIACNLAGEELEDIPVHYEIPACEGISIDENTGLLTVNNDVSLENFVVRAITEDGIVAEKNVDLKVSWTTTQKTENGYDASLASPDEVADILEKCRFLMEEKLILTIRVIGFMSVVLFMGYYLYQRKKKKGQGGI